MIAQLKLCPTRALVCVPRSVLTAVIFLSGAAVPVAGISAQTMSSPPAMSGHATADAAQRLVNFITSVNRDEVALGLLAVNKASSAEVRTFAQHMVDDHTNAQAAWAEKVPSWSLTIPDSAKIVVKPAKAPANADAMANGMSEVRDTTTGLRGGTTAAAIHSANLATLDQLKDLSGAEFDKAFVSARRVAHEAILKELKMQTAVLNDMQPLLTLFRNTIEKHMSEATKLQPD